MSAGRYLDRLWCDEALLGEQDYTSVVVTSVGAVGIEDKPGVPTGYAVAWLWDAFAREPREAEPGFAPPGARAGAAANLELAITEMTPGSAAARMWAGEFGAGHAFVQVDGKLSDADDGTLLCEFSQRTRASGAVGFRDLGGDSGPAMVRQMMGMIARAARNELALALDAPYLTVVAQPPARGVPSGPSASQPASLSVEAAAEAKSLGDLAGRALACGVSPVAVTHFERETKIRLSGTLGTNEAPLAVQAYDQARDAAVADQTADAAQCHPIVVDFFRAYQRL
jgi:Domain of unknown function (DUF4410)